MRFISIETTSLKTSCTTSVSKKETLTPRWLFQLVATLTLLAEQHRLKPCLQKLPEHPLVARCTEPNKEEKLWCTRTEISLHLSQYLAEDTVSSKPMNIAKYWLISHLSKKLVWLLNSSLIVPQFHCLLLVCLLKKTANIPKFTTVTTNYSTSTKKLNQC